MATRRKKKPRSRPKRRATKRSRSSHNGHAGAGKPAKLGRPIWQGHLRLSLVSCPIAIYNATSRTNDISFHLLNPKTHNRIRMIPTDPETGPVERRDLVKGYEIEKDRYITITNEELQSVHLETTQTLDIERFVDEADIDRLYWNDPYYLVPNEKNGVEAFAVLRDAMKDAGRIALGRIVMHTRERLMAVEPRGQGLLAYTLRMQNEVVDPKDAFADIPNTKPSRQMIEIAQKIIDQKEGAFRPAEFKDRYEGALRELIRRKERGEKPVTAPPPEDTNVIDLMEALKRSAARKGAGARPASHRRTRKAG